MSSNARLKSKLFKSSAKENRCEICGINEWLGKPLRCELHHIDGDNKNNELNNLQILCANCHGQTENWRGKNKKVKRNHIADEVFIEAIQSSYTRREALLKIGLAGKGGNYARINSFISSGISLKPHPVNESAAKRLKTIEEKYGSFQASLNHKIDWPSKDELAELLKENSINSLSKKMGVSDSAIRKMAIRYGLDIYSLNPWSRKHNPKQ
jgi:hypothetical protein